MSISFKDNVAVVTGGAMRIGAATARTLCELDAHVGVLDCTVGLSPDPKAVLEGRRRVYPLGRIWLMEEVARAIAFLASDWASFITGALLAVDGGMLVPAGGMGFQKDETGAVGKS